MKLTLLNQLSKAILPKTILDVNTQHSTKPKPNPLLFDLQETINLIDLEEDNELHNEKRKYAFFGIDKNTSKHRAMEEEMETIQKGDPILYRKILSLD